MSPNPKQTALLANPGRRYIPATVGGAWFGYPSAVLDGAPVFSWFDVPRMLRDQQVRFALKMWRAPFQQVKWRVRANSPKVRAYVDMSLRRLWRRWLPSLLNRYSQFGYAAASVSFRYDRKSRLVLIDRARVAQGWDATPRVWKDGPHAGKYAGFFLSGGGVPGMPPASTAGEWVPPSHGIWFAGWEDVAQFYDWPKLAGMFAPWIEKCGRNGAIQARRVGMRKFAFDGGTMHYPEGETNLGTDENPNVMNNQDIARQTVEAMENGSTFIASNEPNAAVDGKYAWDFTPSANRLADTASLREYCRDLDREILIGADIPPEVLEASDVGSGWSGRMIPLKSFYGGVDELVGPAIEALDGPLRYGVRANFGDEWYEIEPIPLVDQLMAASKSGPGGGEGENPVRGLQGMKPKPSQPNRSGKVFKQKTKRWVKPENVELSDGRADPHHRSPARLIAMAMLAAAEKAARVGKPGKARKLIERLAALSPEDVADIVGTSLSWVSYEGPKGGRGWKNTDTGRVVYGGSKPGEKREKAQASAKRAKELIREIALSSDTGPEHLRELADHIPALSVARLRAARIMLGASFGGQRRRDAMVNSLLEHVRGLGEKPVASPAPEPAPKEATGTAAKAEQTRSPAGKTLQIAPEQAAREGWDGGGKSYGTRAEAEAAGGDAVTNIGNKWFALKKPAEKPTPAPATTLPTKNLGTSSPQDFAAASHAATERIADRFGGMVWLGDLFDEMKKDDPSLTREQFNQQMLAANREGSVTLNRADLAQLNPRKTAASEVPAMVGGQKMGSFHLLIPPKGGKAAKHPVEQMYDAGSPSVRDALESAAWNLPHPSGRTLEPKDLHTYLDGYRDGTPAYHSARRKLASGLTAAWQHMHHDAPEKYTDADREQMTAAMQSLVPGLKKIDNADSFDGREHDGEAGMFTGDKGIVTRPGWKIQDGGDDFVVRPAKVKKAEQSPVNPSPTADKPEVDGNIPVSASSGTSPGAGEEGGKMDQLQHLDVIKKANLESDKIYLVSELERDLKVPAGTLAAVAASGYGSIERGLRGSFFRAPISPEAVAAHNAKVAHQSATASAAAEKNPDLRDIIDSAVTRSKAWASGTGKGTSIVDYLNDSIKVTENLPKASRLQAIVREMGGQPAMAKPELFSLVQAAKSQGVVLSPDLDRGAAYYKLSDPKTGNVVLEEVNGIDDIAAATERAKKQMKTKKQATRDRIRGEQSA